VKKTLFILLSFFILATCTTTEWVATSSLGGDKMSPTPRPRGEKLVIIYTADWCYWCKRAKEFMKKNKIVFFERNFDDPNEKKKLKQFAKEVKFTESLDAIPIFIIGRKILIGYSAKQILCELGRKKCLFKTFTTWETPLRK
tara:strand:- start:283 stop:708 length:426 start_codon:yes stop_codon:yes gene_type:complete